MQKLSYVGTGKYPVIGITDDDTLGLIGRMETMDKIKPGDIADGAIPVMDMRTGKMVGYIK